MSETDLPNPESSDPEESVAAEGTSPAAPADPPGGEELLVAVLTEDGWLLGRPATAYVPGEPWEVKYDDGSVRTYSRGPGSVTRVVPGSLLHQVATDAAKVRRRIAKAPAEVIVDLLRESRDRLNKQAIESKLADLRLLPEGNWWPVAARQLKQHVHVAVEGGKYAYSERPVEKSSLAK